MNKKKVICCAGILAVIILAFILVPYIKRVTSDLDVLTTVVCIAHGYYERDGFGYLTIEMISIFDSSRPSVTSTYIVEDAALKQQLSEIDLKDVTGAEILFRVPYKVAEENNFISKGYKGFSLLENGLDLIQLKQSTDKFDKYFRIVAISVQ